MDAAGNTRSERRVIGEVGLAHLALQEKRRPSSSRVRSGFDIPVAHDILRAPSAMRQVTLRLKREV